MGGSDKISFTPTDATDNVARIVEPLMKEALNRLGEGGKSRNLLQPGPYI